MTRMGGLMADSWEAICPFLGALGHGVVTNVTLSLSQIVLYGRALKRRPLSFAD